MRLKLTLSALGIMLLCNSNAQAQNQAIDDKIDRLVKGVKFPDNGNPIQKDMKSSIDSLKGGKTKEAHMFFRSALTKAETEKTLSPALLNDLNLVMACNHDILFRDFKAKYPEKTPYSMNKMKTVLMPKMASDTGRVLKLCDKYLGKSAKETVKIRAAYERFVSAMNRI